MVNSADDLTLITGNTIRKLVIDQSKRANVGHIGSSLSIADIIATLYSDVLRLANTRDNERDRFVLSKGHAALALYCAFHQKGWITLEQLDTYCGDDSSLGVHPEISLNGVDFSTGSLGQGLSMGAGAALAAKMQKSTRRVYVLLSDAELNEGSVWEALMFAAHHGLDNLVAIVDWNGQQAMGKTEGIINNDHMLDRWKYFGWNSLEIDGHNETLLHEKLTTPASGKPTLLLARTTFGKGVSYMENQLKWHYWPMSDEEYQQATQEIGDQL